MPTSRFEFDEVTFQRVRTRPLCAVPYSAAEVLVLNCAGMSTDVHRRCYMRTFKGHYTPTYSSWLNQVELWFSKIERDVIARGVFTSVTDLRSGGPTPIRRGASHDRCTSRSDSPPQWLL